jgi:SH3-like domain-containing protein
MSAPRLAWLQAAALLLLLLGARAQAAGPPLPIPPLPPGAAAAAPARPPAAAPAPAAPAPARPRANPDKGSVTGLPLPRYVSLRTDEVNLRNGPGMQYPIEWLYKRRGLPVEVEREFDVWRLVVDPDGVKGWLHEATITGTRTFVVTGAEHTMRAAPQPDATPVAKLQPGVIGRILHCAAGADWCRVQVKDYRGWLPRNDFWGTKPGEAVQP